MEQIQMMDIVHTMAQHRIAQVRAEEERRARVATEDWLPKGLKWLIDHPKLLKWYVWRLPHRTMIVAVHKQGDFGPAEFIVQKRRKMLGWRSGN